MMAAASGTSSNATAGGGKKTKKKKAQAHPIKETDLERIRENLWRRNRFHLVASQSKLSIDDEESYLFHILATPPSKSDRMAMLHSTTDMAVVHKVKLDLLHELATSGGDVTTPTFKRVLNQLTDLHTLADWDAREDPGMSTDRPKVEGMWLSLSRPNFSGCLGKNMHQEYQYSLGRMSFDMFRPTDLICSIQGTFNPVEIVPRRDRDELVESVPKSLKRELVRGDTVLRSYNIVTAFIIEAGTGPSCPNHAVSMPIKGIMTTNGFVLPDPSNQNRLTVWFSGGSIEVNDDFNLDDWKEIFDDQHLTKRQMSGRARIFAARMLMGAAPPEETGGMEEDGTISYTLNRPKGGHGKQFIDVVYMDSNLRIVKAASGAVYVFARVPH